MVWWHLWTAHSSSTQGPHWLANNRTCAVLYERHYDMLLWLRGNFWRLEMDRQRWELEAILMRVTWSSHFRQLPSYVTHFTMKQRDKNVRTNYLHRTECIEARLSVDFSSLWFIIKGIPGSGSERVKQFMSFNLFLNLSPNKSHFTSLLQQRRSGFLKSWLLATIKWN